MVQVRDASEAGRDFGTLLPKLECAPKSLGDPPAGSESAAWGGPKACLSNSLLCSAVVCCPHFE